MSGRQRKTYWRKSTVETLAVIRAFGPYRSERGKAMALFIEDVHRTLGSQPRQRLGINWWAQQGWVKQETTASGRVSFIDLGDALPEGLRAEIESKAEEYLQRDDDDLQRDDDDVSDVEEPSEVPERPQEALEDEEAVDLTADVAPLPLVTTEEVSPPALPTAEEIAAALLSEVMAVLSRGETDGEIRERLYQANLANANLSQQVTRLKDEIAADKRVIEKYARQIHNLQVSQSRIDDEVREQLNARMRRNTEQMMMPPKRGR